MRDYDQRMIDAITERRNALEATNLIEMSVSEEVAGCSGQPLDDLKRRAQHQLTGMRTYLNEFKQALKTDPADLYIDQP